MNCDGASACVRASTAVVAIVAVTALVLCSPSARAQGTFGSVEGRITCNDGGFPARNAKVDFIQLALLLGEAFGPKVLAHPQSYTAVTDFDGYYSSRTLPPGEYLVLGVLSGYSVDFALIFAHFQEFKPDRQKELLAAFPHVTVRPGSLAHQDVVIRRGAAISGRVTFDSGGSLHDTAVKAAMISSSLFGDAPIDAVKPVDLPNMRGMTNDLGDFRIAGLSAGKYRIYTVINHHGDETAVGGVTIYTPTTPAGPVTVYAPESITEAQSRVIEVGEGDEITDVDISIPLRRLHSIGGTVTRGGIPVDKGSLTIQRQDAVGESDVPIRPDGSYRIDLVPSGTYAIGVQDFYAKKEKQGSPGNNTITVLLGDRDVLNANLDLLGHAPGD